MNHFLSWRFGWSFLVPGLLLALAASPVAQAPDPNADFLRALGQFSLALDGASRRRGRSLRSSLESMSRALDQWDEAIRTAEGAMTAEVVRAEPRTAAEMHATLGGAYIDRGRIEDALREFTAATDLDPEPAGTLHPPGSRPQPGRERRCRCHRRVSKGVGS